MTNAVKPAAIQPPTPSMKGSTASANTYADPNGLAALKRDPNSPQALKAVAQQVDALFLQMMLKSMRDASAASGESSSNEMGMYQDMFDKQIALNLSQHQGLGLGSMVTRRLGAGGAAGGAPPVSPKAGGGSAPVGANGSGAGAIASPPGMAAPSAQTGTNSPPADAAPVTPDSSALAPPTSMAESAADFVGQVMPAIRGAAAALGLDPVALLAQAALETGWGKRMARTADGKPSLNLFGIKADDSWSGARAAARTVEYADGVAVQRHVAFRAYDSIDESVRDFAHLLKNSARYRQAAGAGPSAQAYVAGIHRSGYATDPQYGQKLTAMLHSNTMRSALKTVKL